MGLPFHKYEGLGNDFVIVEAEHESALPAAVARQLCDRRLGVGGDGVLLLLPPSSEGAEARMRVLNADGSVPEMCGNGLRCVVLHVARRAGKTAGEVVIDTDAGVRRSAIDDRDTPALVTVDMGVVRSLGPTTIDLDGDAWDLVLGDAGNPHAITTRPVDRATIDRVGPRLATHPTFPAGTNVEFASFHSGRVDLVVWERGVGITQACGTGACATVAVGVALGKVRVGEDVAVHLPGGVLGVTIQPNGHAIMRGPARHVFSGVAEGFALARHG
ncbi:MAG: diaminopimelate epimerase [Deltaproteobacteria bacterium]|nr:diaminopimelate epimerase [Deltaproteobacteria bacterium]